MSGVPYSRLYVSVAVRTEVGDIAGMDSINEWAKAAVASLLARAVEALKAQIAEVGRRA